MYCRNISKRVAAIFSQNGNTLTHLYFFLRTLQIFFTFNLNTMNNNQLTPEQLANRRKLNKKIYAIFGCVFFVLFLFWQFGTGESSPSEPTVMIDITKIVGKTPEEVEKVLGKALDTTKVKPSQTPCPPCLTMNYEKGTSVTYMEGVAEWIMLDTLATGFPITADAKSLEYLGIKTDIEPKEDGNTSRYDLIWENVNDIRFIRIHVKMDDNVSTGAYIKRKYM